MKGWKIIFQPLYICMVHSPPPTGKMDHAGQETLHFLTFVSSKCSGSSFELQSLAEAVFATRTQLHGP